MHVEKTVYTNILYECTAQVMTEFAVQESEISFFESTDLKFLFAHRFIRN